METPAVSACRNGWRRRTEVPRSLTGLPLSCRYNVGGAFRAITFHNTLTRRTILHETQPAARAGLPRWDPRALPWQGHIDSPSRQERGILESRRSAAGDPPEINPSTGYFRVI